MLYKMCPFQNPEFGPESNMTWWKAMRSKDGTAPTLMGEDGKTFQFSSANRYIPADKWSKVNFTTADGVKIAGNYAYGHSCAPVVILMHGFSQCSGKWEVTFLAHMLWSNGFNVLSYDMRNHGRSSRVTQKKSGKVGVVTWGTSEYKDAQAAMDWLHDTMGYPTSRVGLSGPSLSGATVAVTLGKDKRFKAAWSDSPACNTEDCIQYNMQSPYNYGGVTGYVAPQFGRMLLCRCCRIRGLIVCDWISNSKFRSHRH